MMDSIDDIQELEKLIGQLKALHSEVGQLARKSPNDGINSFKLKLINKTIARANKLLGDEYVPFDDFDGFEEDDMPSNSDITMVIAQYLEEAERYRSNNVEQDLSKYYYKVGGKRTDVRAAPPTWSKK
jgi:hypothetical protein